MSLKNISVALVCFGILAVSQGASAKETSSMWGSFKHGVSHTVKSGLGVNKQQRATKEAAKAEQQAQAEAEQAEQEAQQQAGTVVQ